MDSAGAIPETIWNSFNAAMQVEESELMAQLLGTYPFLNEQGHDQSIEIPPMFWAADSYYSSQDANSTLCYWPQESAGSLSIGVPAISGAGSSLPMDFCMMGGQQITTQSLQLVPSNSSAQYVSMNEETSSDDLGDLFVHDQKPQLKRKLHKGAAAESDKLDIQSESSKKKTRASSQVQRSAKNVKSKKAQKSIKSGDEEEGNTTLNGQSSSCYSSEDDYSSASQELSRGGSTGSRPKGSAAVNIDGKTRAGRGSATDPQSLYARKRRERINERLRILQNLVPNGTKVDISTMLEEAVQYVKFLQLQIKLLSSDDLWMYAPIAYNGINIGLDLNIAPPKQ